MKNLALQLKLEPNMDKLMSISTLAYYYNQLISIGASFFPKVQKPLEDFNHIAWFPNDEAIENSNMVAINEVKLGKSAWNWLKIRFYPNSYNRVRKSEELVLKLINTTNSHHNLLSQLESTDATLVEVYSAGNTDVVHTTLHYEILISNKHRAIREPEIENHSRLLLET